RNGRAQDERDDTGAGVRAAGWIALVDDDVRVLIARLGGRARGDLEGRGLTRGEHAGGRRTGAGRLEARGGDVQVDGTRVVAEAGRVGAREDQGRPGAGCRVMHVDVAVATRRERREGLRRERVGRIAS